MELKHVTMSVYHSLFHRHARLYIAQCRGPRNGSLIAERTSAAQCPPLSPNQSFYLVCVFRVASHGHGAEHFLATHAGDRCTGFTLPLKVISLFIVDSMEKYLHTCTHIHTYIYKFHTNLLELFKCSKINLFSLEVLIFYNMIYLYNIIR